MKKLELKKLVKEEVVNILNEDLDFESSAIKILRVILKVK